MKKGNKMKESVAERKPLLSVAREFLGTLQHLLKFRPLQLMFMGIAVIGISLPILDYYNISQWIMLIPIFICLGIILLGIMDLPDS